jgi:hypothetical protein
MEGRIREYSHQTRQGVITGEDGANYSFSESQWEAHGLPMPGMAVDFQPVGDTAANIRLASGTFWSRLSARPGQRSRSIAAVLAIFAGYLGAHKIYMGKPGPGAAHLALTASGIFLWVVPNVVLEDSPAEALLICVLGWAAAFGVYFAVRRFYLRHSTHDILRPLRVLRWPFLIFRIPRNLGQRAAGTGSQPSGQGQASAGSGNQAGGTAAALIFHTLSVALYVTFAIAILFLFYVLAMLIGFFLIAASLGIGVVEGFQYLRKSDADFNSVYLEQGRSWF